MINWPNNGCFLSNYPVQNFTGLSGTLLNRDLMPALIMAYKFLSEILNSPSQVIAGSVGFSSLHLKK